MPIITYTFDFNAAPEKNTNPRVYSANADFTNFVKQEFTPAEQQRIFADPILSARIEAARQRVTMIGYRDNYKMRRNIADARQAYNFATKNPIDFLKQELPAYIYNSEGSKDIIKKLFDLGVSQEELIKIYETSYEDRNSYGETESQYLNRTRQRGRSPFQVIAPLAGIALSVFAPGIGTAIGTAIGASGAAAAVIGQAIVQGALTELSGGDFVDGAIQGAVAAGISAPIAKTVGQNIANAMADSTVKNVVANTVASAAASAANAAITGGDIEKAAAIGATIGGAGSLGRDIGTAINYGTTPLSDQTTQLAAQEVGLGTGGVAGSELGKAAGAIAIGAPVEQSLISAAAQTAGQISRVTGQEPTTPAATEPQRTAEQILIDQIQNVAAREPVGLDEIELAAAPTTTVTDVTAGIDAVQKPNWLTLDKNERIVGQRTTPDGEVLFEIEKTNPNDPDRKIYYTARFDNELNRVAYQWNATTGFGESGEAQGLLSTIVRLGYSKPEFGGGEAGGGIPIENQPAASATAGGTQGLTLTDQLIIDQILRDTGAQAPPTPAPSPTPAPEPVPAPAPAPEPEPAPTTTQTLPSGAGTGVQKGVPEAVLEGVSSASAGGVEGGTAIQPPEPTAPPPKQIPIVAPQQPQGQEGGVSEAERNILDAIAAERDAAGTGGEQGAGAGTTGGTEAGESAAGIAGGTEGATGTGEAGVGTEGQGLAGGVIGGPITDQEIINLILADQGLPEETLAQEEIPLEEELGLEEELALEEELPIAEAEEGVVEAILERPTIASARRPTGFRAREEVAQTVSPRVTGEALVGILGEKEPLFGGDEDEQRAVWNRRSLRLRRALGL